MDTEKKIAHTEQHKPATDNGYQHNASDLEYQHSIDHEAGTTVHLQRRLQSRHLQMIAIGSWSLAADKC